MCPVPRSACWSSSKHAALLPVGDQGLNNRGCVCHADQTGRKKRGLFNVDVVLTEWLSFLLRWLHVIAGIAWIGSSFYFIHLDLSLKPRPGLPSGVKGDAWQVHGGGFYHM